MPKCQYNLYVPTHVRDVLTADGGSTAAKDALRRQAVARTLAVATGLDSAMIEHWLMLAEYGRDLARRNGDLDTECALSAWLNETDLLLARHGNGADITLRALELVNNPPAALQTIATDLGHRS